MKAKGKIMKPILTLLTALLLAPLAALDAAEPPRVTLDDRGSVTRLNVMGQEHTSAQRMGLFVRESPAGELLPVAMGSGKKGVTTLDANALRLEAELETSDDRLVLSGAIEDMRATEDRGVDVVLRLPFSPAVWWGGISEPVAPDAKPRRARKPRTQEQLVEGAAALEPIEDGGLAQNFLPIGCVTSADEKAGLAIALPPDMPCRFRFAHLREEGCIELQFLFGLSAAATGDLKSRAPFRCEIFAVDGHWGMRDAWRRYWAMHPDSFQRRTKASGLWLVGLPELKEVPDPQNYAFWQTIRPKEIAAGAKLGWEAYPYTIVGQREVGYIKDKVSSYDDVARVLVTKPDTSKRSRYTWEEVKALVEISGLQGPDGRWLYRPRETDWAGNSISFPTSPSPFLPATNERPSVAMHTLAEVERDIREHPQIAGSFVDSLGMWGSYENYRRDHFAAARSPLTHDPKGRVSIQNWMPHVDYLRELRLRIAPRLVFGNGARPGRAFCAMQLDVFGVEFSPRDLGDRTQMDFARCLAGPKPVCGLFDYEPHKGLPREQMEDYVNRCTALGITPETRHWKWPEYKDRDADLMAKFLPIVRKLDLAGWQPVTSARVSPSTLWIERFGSEKTGPYYTIFNPADEEVAATLSIEGNAGKSWLELVTNQHLKEPAQALVVPARSVRVIQISN
jgi:hypothetical protein